MAATGTTRRGARAPRRGAAGRARAPRHGRMCVGCGTREPTERVRDELLRLVLVPEPEGGGYRVVADLAGGATGRGAWVHARSDCLDRAVAKGLSRSAKAPVRADRPALDAAIAAAAERRLVGLLSAAYRSRQLAVGATAVASAWQQEQVQLILLARDAAGAARLSEVLAAGRAGQVLVWGSTDSLGRSCGRPTAPVAVVAIRSASIAGEVRRVIGLLELCASATDAAGAVAATSPAHSSAAVSSDGRARGFYESDAERSVSSGEVTN